MQDGHITAQGPYTNITIEKTSKGHNYSFDVKHADNSVVSETLGLQAIGTIAKLLEECKTVIDSKQ